MTVDTLELLAEGLVKARRDRTSIAVMSGCATHCSNTSPPTKPVAPVKITFIVTCSDIGSGSEESDPFKKRPLRLFNPVSADHSTIFRWCSEGIDKVLHVVLSAEQVRSHITTISIVLLSCDGQSRRPPETAEVYTRLNLDGILFGPTIEGDDHFQ